MNLHNKNLTSLLKAEKIMFPPKPGGQTDGRTIGHTDGH